MSRSVALALALLMTVPAFAEDPAAEKRPEERIVGIRYTLMMRTGREIGGIVRVAGVFERRVRGVWEECDPEDSGAGVRLWFPKQQDGYTFHPIRQIKQLEEVGPVTADESASIQRARRAAQSRADAEREELKRRREEEARRKAEAEAAERGETETPETPPDASEKPATEKPATDEEKKREERFEELLLEYPPTDWKPDRPKKIERRRVVLGLFPSEEEKAFLAVFEEWKEAFAWWEAKIEESKGNGQADDSEQPAKGSTRSDAGGGADRDTAKTTTSRE